MPKKKDKTILRETVFKKINYYGNGGFRRSAQIGELVHSAGFGVVDIPRKFSSSSRTLRKYLKDIRSVVWSVLFFTKHGFQFHPDYEFLQDCGYLYQSYREALIQHNSEKILLWEATREKHYMAPYIAKDADFKVIAVPQNLESLSTGNVDPFNGQSLPYSLQNELKHLAVADVVFCIAREEQWLLNLFGIEAEFLPYYPPKPALESLLEIRQKRNHSQDKKQFLVLGTAQNPPTKLGMIELIKILQKIHQELDFTIDLAGYSTELLQGSCEGVDFITFHGTLTTDKLNELLIKTTAVLIYQKTGVGALTRIPDTLIAGIPVIANGNACRSAFGYPGVYCYDSEEELAELMSRNLEEPDVIPRPEKAEKRFIDCLKGNI